MSSLLKVNSELKSKVEMFREQITNEAEHLVSSIFPQKLLELDQFLKVSVPFESLMNMMVDVMKHIHSEITCTVPEPLLFANSHDDVGVDSRKRKLGDGVAEESRRGGTEALVTSEGTMKCNTQLADLIERVKLEIRMLIEKCNTVKMWVQLLIPRIEDGNNFGVSIQEETVTELRTVESDAASYLDQISRYYITRAKLVSKIAKYPHVEDYRRTVSETDEKEYISLKIIVSELRNQYVTLHDMILKNIEKIKKPRSSNSEALY